MERFSRTAPTILSILFLTCATWSSAQVSTRIADSPESVCPLLPGAQTPDSVVRDLDGKVQSLKDLISEKPTVLIFFRGGW